MKVLRLLAVLFLAATCVSSRGITSNKQNDNHGQHHQDSNIHDYHAHHGSDKKIGHRPPVYRPTPNSTTQSWDSTDEYETTQTSTDEHASVTETQSTVLGASPEAVSSVVTEAASVDSATSLVNDAAPVDTVNLIANETPSSENEKLRTHGSKQ